MQKLLPCRRSGRQRREVSYNEPSIAEVLASAPAAVVRGVHAAAPCRHVLRAQHRCKTCTAAPSSPCAAAHLNLPSAQERAPLPDYDPPAETPAAARIQPSFNPSEGERDSKGGLQRWSASCFDCGAAEPV